MDAATMIEICRSNGSHRDAVVVRGTRRPDLGARRNIRGRHRRHDAGRCFRRRHRGADHRQPGDEGSPSPALSGAGDRRHRRDCDDEIPCRSDGDRPRRQYPGARPDQFPVARAVRWTRAGHPLADSGAHAGRSLIYPSIPLLGPVLFMPQPALVYIALALYWPPVYFSLPRPAAVSMLRASR